MKTPNDYYLDFERRFSLFTNDHLVNAYNLEVANMSSGLTHASYLAALHNELHKRELDYSAIGNSESISFNDKVELLGNVIRKVK